MVREISSGGVVIKLRDGVWWMAAIEPAEGPAGDVLKPTEGSTKEPTEDKPVKKRARRKKSTLALPKGLVDPGEKPLETALREVYEETGITAEAITKLADIKYVYVRSWGDRERVFKIVSFYLMRYRSGRINEISPEMRVEVAQARWIPLDDAPKLLAYRGEKQMARKAIEYLAANSDQLSAASSCA